MIGVIDKYGNSSSDRSSIIIIDKYGNIKKPPLTNLYVTGNVGIGTTTPSTTLQVSSATNKGVVIGTTSYPSWMGTDGLYVDGSFRANTYLVGSGSAINWGASQAQIMGYNPSTGSNTYLSFLTGGISAFGERMRIIDNGNVGIGTTTPTAKLEVIGDIRASSSITTSSLFSTNGGEIRISQTDLGFASNITQKWSSTGDSNGPRDIGFRRNTAGVLEIYDGITADGAVANRRDLLVRNLTSSQNFTLQPTPTALSATATLTIAQILTNIINVTSTIAVTLTLPTGTLTDAGVLAGALPVNTGFDWTIINTGSSIGIITLAVGTAHTIVGNTMIAIGDSAAFRTVKTATNTFITYRIT